MRWILGGALGLPNLSDAESAVLLKVSGVILEPAAGMIEAPVPPAKKVDANCRRFSSFRARWFKSCEPYRRLSDLSTNRRLTNNCTNLVEFGRLAQVSVEAGLFDALDDLCATKGSHSTKQNFAPTSLGANLSCCLQAVHVRHTDIHQYDSRVQIPRKLDCFLTVRGNMCVVAFQSQERRRCPGNVCVIIDYQNAAPRDGGMNNSHVNALKVLARIYRMLKGGERSGRGSI